MQCQEKFFNQKKYSIKCRTSIDSVTLDFVLYICDKALCAAANLRVRGRAMYPFVFGFRAYTACQTAGTVCAAVIMMIMLLKDNRNFIRSLIIGAMFAAIINIGSAASQFLRKLTYWRGADRFVSEFADYQGKHFLGSVLFAVIVFPLVYKCVMRRESGVFARGGLDKATEINGVFITVQHFFNRLGCLLEGCCYGKAYYGFGAMHFPNVAHPVYPTQAFEMLAMAVLFAVLMHTIYKKKTYSFGIFCIGYSAAIFVSEFFMDQTGTFMFAGMSFIQLAALVLAAIGVYSRLKHKKRV